MIEFQAAGDFPVEVMLTVLLLTIAFILMVWLRKRHPESAAVEQPPIVQIERAPILNTERVIEEPTTKNMHVEEIDLHHIRTVYREFEQEAEASGYGRGASETVREWMARMNWQVSEEFFSTYELVRYGQGAVSMKDANPFLEEILRLTEKNFLKEV